MNDKDRIIEEFFRSLRVALTNAFSYSKDHPYFIKSVENFKLKLDALLAILDPFQIGVSNAGFLVDGKNLVKTGIYDELSRLLHQRKIKSIEIRSGSSLREVVQFLSFISLPQKDIIKNGGINALLGKERLSHFTIQELDYSEFLHGEGQECADVWSYMLKEAVESKDAVKLDQLAEDFGSFIKQVNDKDLFDAEGISPEVKDFLVCLKDNNKEKFSKCLNDVFLWLLRNKKNLSNENLAKLKPVFQGLNQDEFTALLKEGFSQEDNFDSLSLQVFSKISEQENLPKITESFFNKISDTPGLRDDPRAVKKVRDLLSTSADDPMSAVYRNTLDSLVKNISFSGKLTFDHKLLRENYRYMVLGIFSTDEDADTLELTAGILEKELPAAFEDNAIVFLKDLWGVLITRKKDALGLCERLEKQLSSIVENMALKGNLTDEQEFLLEMVAAPGQDFNLYLERIFAGERANKQVLSLFLKLFPGNLEAFYARVDKKIQDTEFIVSLIDALGQLEKLIGPEILEYIYASANELIKSEILKVMRNLKQVDVLFLTRQFNTDSLVLRRGIISVLILDDQGRLNALDLLFKISSFLGNKNNLLIEHMQIAFDLKFIEAVSFIRDLSKRKFFWNWELSKKAAKILKEWNVS